MSDFKLPSLRESTEYTGKTKSESFGEEDLNKNVEDLTKSIEDLNKNIKDNKGGGGSGGLDDIAISILKNVGIGGMLAAGAFLPELVETFKKFRTSVTEGFENFTKKISEFNTSFSTLTETVDNINKRLANIPFVVGGAVAAKGAWDTLRKGRNDMKKYKPETYEKINEGVSKTKKAVNKTGKALGKAGGMLGKAGGFLSGIAPAYMADRLANYAYKDQFGSEFGQTNMLTEEGMQRMLKEKQRKDKESKDNISPKIKKDPLEALKKLIDQGESGGYYDIVYGGERKRDLTNMSVEDILKYQEELIRTKGHSPVGRYQINKQTLKGLADSGYVNYGMKFDKEGQDKIFNALLQQSGFGQFTSGKMSNEEFANKLAGRWSSFETSKGVSRYHDIGERSTVKYEDVLKSLEDFKKVNTMKDDKISEEEQRLKKSTKNNEQERLISHTAPSNINNSTTNIIKKDVKPYIEDETFHRMTNYTTGSYNSFVV